MVYFRKLNLILGVICGFYLTQTLGFAANKTPKKHWVIVSTVSNKALSATPIYSGTLKARMLRRIFNEEAGRIVSLPYFEGDAVKQGDVLVRLDARRLAAQRRKAQATWRQAQLNVQRLAALRKHGQAALVTEAALSEARTIETIAQAEVDLLVLRVEAMTLYAPFDGLVSARLVEVGDVLPAYQHLLSLFNPQDLLVEVWVSAQRLANLQQGDVAEVRIDALGEAYFKGNIKRIHPLINPQNRQGIVEIKLLDLPIGAKAGQFCRVRLYAKQPQQYFNVAYRAVRHDTVGDYVFVLDVDNRVQRKAVKIGRQLADRVEIIRGLNLQDRVVSQGFLNLKVGMLVDVVQ